MTIQEEHYKAIESELSFRLTILKAAIRRLFCKHIDWEHIQYFNDGELQIDLTCANCGKRKYYNIKRN